MNTKTPTVLITGVAGFIGMHSAIRFINEGWDVIGIDNMNSYYSTDLKRDRIENIEGKTKLRRGSFTFLLLDIAEDIQELIPDKSIDLVIHLAAQAGVRYSLTNSEEYVKSNLVGFHKVLEFIKYNGITKFIYASSSSVYGENNLIPYSEEMKCDSPESFYAATKKANEEMAFSYFKTFGISSVGLRFFTVYGPWGRPDMAPMLFLDSVLSGKEINVFNNGESTRDFTYVEDIVEGIYTIGCYHDFIDSEIFNIGSGISTGLIDFIGIIENLSGKRAKMIKHPAQKGDVSHTLADITKLHKRYGYNPRFTLEEGLASFYEWYKQYDK